jgi:AraC family transcriptional regulator
MTEKNAPSLSRGTICPSFAGKTERLMNVEIVVFPETKVAAIEHHGPPEREHDTARRLIAWKLDQRLLDPSKHRSYGIHYTDPRTTPPADHRVDFCLSVEHDVAPNSFGILTRVIPANRCARARDIGSRHDNKAVVFLYGEWLARSGEAPGDFPVFFHYVNAGPNVRREEMITDVYLPLR